MTVCDICSCKLERRTLFEFSNLKTANDNHRFDLCSDCANELATAVEEKMVAMKKGKTKMPSGRDVEDVARRGFKGLMEGERKP